MDFYLSPRPSPSVCPQTFAPMTVSTSEASLKVERRRPLFNPESADSLQKGMMGNVQDHFSVSETKHTEHMLCVVSFSLLTLLCPPQQTETPGTSSFRETHFKSCLFEIKPFGQTSRLAQTVFTLWLQWPVLPLEGANRYSEATLNTRFTERCRVVGRCAELTGLWCVWCSVHQTGSWPKWNLIRQN